MPGYRIRFGATYARANDMADTMVAADGTLGEAVNGLSEVVEVVGTDALVGLGVAQFAIRFTAATDDEAYAVRASVRRSVTAPIDAERLDRRSRPYLAA